MSKKAFLIILTLVIIGNSSRAEFNLNRDEIVNNARVGIDLSGNYNIININLSSAGSQIGNGNIEYSFAYQQIQQVTEQIRQLKLKLNPVLNTSYN